MKLLHNIIKLWVFKVQRSIVVDYSSASKKYKRQNVFVRSPEHANNKTTYIKSNLPGKVK